MTGSPITAPAVPAIALQTPNALLRSGPFGSTATRSPTRAAACSRSSHTDPPRPDEPQLGDAREVPSLAVLVRPVGQLLVLEPKRFVDHMHNSQGQQRLASPAGLGSLYERVLGEQATRLHAQVAALHCGTASLRATGRMRVERGSGLLSRLVAMVVGLPRSGSDVPTRLVIVRHGGCERWVREFGGAAAIRSQQTGGRAGELVERFGVLAFVFVLDVAGEALRFRQRACHVRIGGVRLPIPSVLAPCVSAVVAPAACRGAVVSVRVDTPLLGRLLAYVGTVQVQEILR